MNLKVDENLSPDVAALFREHGHDADTVAEEGLAAHPDDEIAERANAEGRILVTLDRAFGDVRRFPPGTHPGIIVLRPETQLIPSILGLAQRILELPETDSWTGCNVVVQPNGIRIRRPDDVA